MHSSERRHVLITFGRSFLTLNLARLMSAAGHRVTVVDCIPIGVSRFSNTVDAFFRVPPPKFEPRSYAREVARIAREQRVDMVIPVHEETDILAMLADYFDPSIELFLSGFDLENQLHNKYDYSELLESKGLPALKYARVASPDDVAALDFDAPFALKECYSRGSQKVHKVYPGDDLSWLTFDPENPWLAQEWMSGDKYCTYSVCRAGKIYAHATYPVDYAIGGSSCLNFTSVDHPQIFEWVRDFVADIGFTGQVGFDFIEHPDRGLFSIECNPRGTSGIMMFDDDDRVDRAFFGENDTLITPRPDVHRMIGIGMLLFGWTKASRGDRSIREYLRAFSAADDVISHPGDEKPFVLLPLAYAGIVRSCIRYRVGLAEGFMHDHEWDGRRLG